MTGLAAGLGMISLTVFLWHWQLSATPAGDSSRRRISHINGFNAAGHSGVV